MLYESLSLPKWLEQGIKPNHRGSRVDKLIYGADTETVRGKPNSIQIYSEDIACSEIIFCNERNARQRFLKFCAGLKRKTQHVFYIHNLAFDLIELLWGKHERLIENSGEFDFSSDGFTIRGIYGAPTFCTLRKGDDICVHLCDSFSFYRGSLAQAAMLYCPELPKLQRPVGLGERRYTASSTQFVEYAMRDAQVTYHIGRAIEELHHEFDLKQCVSIADMAARIFRHRFLTYTIPQPTPDVIYASLDAYHGGKNNLAVAPGVYSDVRGIDISSAYPHAMRDMPSFSDGSLYKPYRCKRARRVRSLPPYGVYCITGEVATCRWPSVFSHGFKSLRGNIESVWIQGFEANEAISSGELSCRTIFGIYYDESADIQAPALRQFCEDFYRRKQNEKDKVRRYGYKLILNSISGKFIQTRKRNLKAHVNMDTLEVGTASELVAGGMFHPFIAAAITAHTRARIHGLEHKYEALHTATDGIFTQQRCAADVVRGDATQLGQLTQDAEGELLIVRNKCYVMYDKKAEKKSKAFRGKRIAKYALHGFQGTVHDLERLVKTGKRTYHVTRPNKLKESLARGLTPNDFRRREMRLNVPDFELAVSE
jgi:DNA polymerase type B, organellar and viral